MATECEGGWEQREDSEECPSRVVGPSSQTKPVGARYRYLFLAIGLPASLHRCTAATTGKGFLHRIDRIDIPLDSALAQVEPSTTQHRE